MKRSAVVSIIGRPNVGKSSIFNRLMRKAHLNMTYDQPGVTRDRHYGILTLDEFHNQSSTDIILVDTGGFYPEKVHYDRGKNDNIEPFFHLMGHHADKAMDESDLILLVVDVREGLHHFDKKIAQMVFQKKKPCWLLVNKFDTEKQQGDEFDFYELGFEPDQILLLSAEHARGFQDFREKLQAFAQKIKAEEEQVELKEKGIKPEFDVVASVAIIGAPNAGKSTLLNTLVGAERALVSDIPGTTVDPISSYINLYFPKDLQLLAPQENEFRKNDEKIYEEMQHSYQTQANDFEDAVYIEYGELEPNLVLEQGDGDASSFEEETLPAEDQIETGGYRSVKIVDTAGIRRSKMVEGFIEEQSVYRSLKAISESDIVIYMMDAQKGTTHQDRRLCDIALEKGKSVILVYNKIDTLKEIFQNPQKRKEWIQDQKDLMPWMNFCQIVTLSAKFQNNIQRLKKALVESIYVRRRRVSTGELNRSIIAMVDKNPVVVQSSGGVKLKVKYASMLKSDPPTFLLFSNKSQGIPDHYRRYLVNSMRKEFNLKNTPVHLIFRTSSDLERRMKKVEKKKITR